MKNNSRQNLEAPQRPPINPAPPMLKKFSHKIIAIIVLVAIAAIAAYIALKQKSSISTINNIPIQNSPIALKNVTEHFDQPELGLSFDYPKEWGIARENIKISPIARIDREITFSNNKNLVFNLVSQVPISHFWQEYTARYLFDVKRLEPFPGEFPLVKESYHAYSLNMPLKDICKIFVKYYDSDYFSHLLDPGRQGVFGDCAPQEDSLIFVTKAQRISSTEQLPEPTALEMLAFIPLKSTLFPIATLYMKNAELDLLVKNSNYCNDLSHQDSQKYSNCLSGTLEASDLQTAWSAFTQSQAGKEIISLQKSIRTTTPTTQQTHATYLNKLAPYKSKNFPVQFMYPEAFGDSIITEGKTPKSFFSGTYTIGFPGLAITVTSRQDAIQKDLETQKCKNDPEVMNPGECGEENALHNWDNDKKFLESAMPNKDCKNGDVCLFKEKAIIRYLSSFAGEISSWKDYIYYNEGYRYAVRVGPFYTAEIEDIQKSESSDIGLKTLNAIAKSISFVK